MKIICVGRNYAEHASEMNAERPAQPVIFMKPDTALLRNNMPFFLPDWANRFDYECELVVRISRLGRCIDERFAHRYYDAVGLGIDFTARDLQDKFKAGGLPWELCKGFDQSAAISQFIPLSDLPALQDLTFSLDVNGERRQTGCPKDMLFSVDQIISFVSRYVSLRIGDFIFTGTPAGVGPVAIGDRLTARLGDSVLMDFLVK